MGPNASIFTPTTNQTVASQRRLGRRMKTISLWSFAMNVPKVLI